MGRRKHAAPPFSLFAFQDVITAVTGILILITIMMAISLVARKHPATQTAAPSEIASELQALKQELERVQASPHNQLKVVNMLPEEVDGKIQTLNNEIIQLTLQEKELKTKLENLAEEDKSANQ